MPPLRAQGEDCMCKTGVGVTTWGHKLTSPERGITARNARHALTGIARYIALAAILYTQGRFETPIGCIFTQQTLMT
jgi:hypothetical protein